MTGTTKLSSNKQVLQEAEHVQSKTRESLIRIQEQAAAAELLGGETLEELYNQRQQLYTIEKESNKLNSHLRKTSKLQNQFDRWAGHWRGSHKREAKRDAKEQLGFSRKEKENKSANKYKVTASSTTANINKKKKKKDDVLHSVSRNTGKDNTETQELDQEDLEALDRVKQNDAEIDEMLDAADRALDRLNCLASSIKEETQTHSQQIDTTDALLEKANTKQQVINGRLKRLLRK